MRVDTILLGVAEKRRISCVHIWLFATALLGITLLGTALLAHCPLSLWAKIMWCW